jgi:YbbR domain-containing protein
LEIWIDREIQKTLPIILSFKDEPAPWFFIAGAEAKPAAATIRGPETILGPLDKITTKPLDVHDAMESFKKEIALELPEGLHIMAPKGKIIAEIKIDEKIASKTFENLPVLGKNAKYPFTISPATISIIIKGPVHILNKIQPDSGIQIYIDLGDLKPGTYSKKTSISLPLKTILVEAKPDVFKVNIKKSGAGG